jgi:hypothetical protein
LPWKLRKAAEKKWPVRWDSVNGSYYKQRKTILMEGRV